MNIINILSNFFKKPFNKKNNYKQLESHELSIIDTSTLQIDENFTDLEKEEYQELVSEIKQGDIATIITYGNDIAKRINGLMDISRKRINQNIEENKSLVKLGSTEDVISHKLKIIFNNAEIDNIIEELKELRRSCEIRVLALKNVGEESLRKSQRRINLFSNKYDSTRVNSINNAISRLSSSIKIISMLINSIKIEQYNSQIENDAIDKYLENNNPNENIAITNMVLKNTFEELKRSLTAIGELSNEPMLLMDKTPINEIDFDSLSIDSKIDVIANTKKYLDLYVIKNKEDFLKEGGIFSKVNNNLNQLWDEIESDYYDWDLWAKKVYASKFVEVDDGRLRFLSNKRKFYSRKILCKIR